MLNSCGVQLCMLSITWQPWAVTVGICLGAPYCQPTFDVLCFLQMMMWLRTRLLLSSCSLQHEGSRGLARPQGTVLLLQHFTLLEYFQLS